MSDTLATGTAPTDRERVLGRRRERVGPGGDPVAPAPAETERPTGGDGVVLDCGWGRLVFGQTFTDQAAVAAVLRSEAAGARDICIYLRDPHVLVSRLPDELFIDPSLTYRLRLPANPAGPRSPNRSVARSAARSPARPTTCPGCGSGRCATPTTRTR